MSTHIKILSQQDVNCFELPPKFTGEDRKRYFLLPKLIESLIKDFKSINKVGFILQFVYFKIANRFFIPKKFYKRDIEFIANKLEIDYGNLDILNYKEGTYRRHQELILEKLGFQKFNDEIKTILTKESLRLCQIQLKPKFIFMSLVDFLRNKKIQIPSYHGLSEIITESLRNYEKSLLKLINDNLSSEVTQYFSICF